MMEDKYKKVVVVSARHPLAVALEGRQDPVKLGPVYAGRTANALRQTRDSAGIA